MIFFEFFFQRANGAYETYPSQGGPTGWFHPAPEAFWGISSCSCDHCTVIEMLFHSTIGMRRHKVFSIQPDLTRTRCTWEIMLCKGCNFVSLWGLWGCCTTMHVAHVTEKVEPSCLLIWQTTQVTYTPYVISFMQQLYYKIPWEAALDSAVAKDLWVNFSTRAQTLRDLPCSNTLSSVWVFLLLLLFICIVLALRRSGQDRGLSMLNKYIGWHGLCSEESLQSNLRQDAMSWCNSQWREWRERMIQW